MACIDLSSRLANSHSGRNRFPPSRKRECYQQQMYDVRSVQGAQLFDDEGCARHDGKKMRGGRGFEETVLIIEVSCAGFASLYKGPCQDCAIKTQCQVCLGAAHERHSRRNLHQNSDFCSGRAVALTAPTLTLTELLSDIFVGELDRQYQIPYKPKWMSGGGRGGWKGEGMTRSNVPWACRQLGRCNNV